MPASFRGRTCKPPQPPASGTPRQEVPVDPHHGVQAGPTRPSHQLSRNLDSPKLSEPGTVSAPQCPQAEPVKPGNSSVQPGARPRRPQPVPVKARKQPEQASDQAHRAPQPVPVKARKGPERAGDRARGGPGGRPPEGIAVHGAGGQRPTSSGNGLAAELMRAGKGSVQAGDRARGVRGVAPRKESRSTVQVAKGRQTAVTA